MSIETNKIEKRYNELMNLVVARGYNVQFITWLLLKLRCNNTFNQTLWEIYNLSDKDLKDFENMFYTSK